MTPWQKVGDGCFRRRYPSLDLNVGVVRGSDALLVLDTRCHAVEARELLDELTMLRGPSRVGWIVNTHWHFDHVFGNATLRGVAPDAPIYAHRSVPRDLARFGEQARAEWSRRKPEWAEELAAVEIVAPDHMVDDAVVVDLGDRLVELRHPGPAHTAGDLVALVADAGVVFAGDIVEESAAPSYGDDSFPLDWPSAIATLLEWTAPRATVVPGHGDIVDRAFVAEQQLQLATVAQTIRTCHAAGVPIEQALEAGVWPFPKSGLGNAVARGYAALSR